MVISYSDLKGITALPSKYNSPLLINPYRMLALVIPPEGLESIPWRNPQILQLGRIVQIKQLAPGCTVQFPGKRAHGPGTPVMVKVFSQPVPERFNHVLSGYRMSITNTKG